MKSIHILGAGGIGCAIAYALRRAGLEVTLIDADPEKVAWGREHGVRVDDLPPLRARFLHFDDWVPEAGRPTLLCTKCYDNARVLARLPAGLSLVPIQNGFDPALDRRGDGLEGIASFVSECASGRTHTRITRPGKLHLGPRGSAKRKPLSPILQLHPAQKLVDVLRTTSLFHVVPVPDILPYKYTKLMYNAAISPLASAAGIDNGQLLSVEPARRLFFALLRENYAILRHARVPLGKVGPFHPDTVAWILRHVAVSRVLAWAFTPSLRGTYCSMAHDLPRGRTEIDYYNGRLIELAGDLPCPLNRRLVALVKRMERTRTPPGLVALAELQEVPLAA